jgi:hypothetical protein
MILIAIISCEYLEQLMTDVPSMHDSLEPVQNSLVRDVVPRDVLGGRDGESLDLEVPVHHVGEHAIVVVAIITISAVVLPAQQNRFRVRHESLKQAEGCSLYHIGYMTSTRTHGTATTVDTPHINPSSPEQPG